MKKLLLLYITILLISKSIYAPFDQLLNELQAIQTGNDSKALQQQKLAITIKVMACIKQCYGLLEDARKDCMHNCLKT